MWVVCLPGYDNTGSWRDEYTGGSGWEEDKITQVKRIDSSNREGEAIAWPEGSSGIYAQALRPATKWEIEHRQIQKEIIYEIF